MRRRRAVERLTPEQMRMTVAQLIADPKTPPGIREMMRSAVQGWAAAPESPK